MSADREEALERDAARYRWLRENTYVEGFWLDGAGGVDTKVRVQGSVHFLDEAVDRERGADTPPVVARPTDPREIRRAEADCATVVRCETLGYCQGGCSLFEGLQRDRRTHRFMQIVEELEAPGAPKNLRGTLLGALEEAAGFRDVEPKMGDQALTDHVDLMVDEFKRIAALVPSSTEIAQLCERAITKTAQRVPVIAQRDRAEAEAAAMRRNACALVAAGSNLKRLNPNSPDAIAWDAALAIFVAESGAPLPIVCRMDDAPKVGDPR